MSFGKKVESLSFRVFCQNIQEILTVIGADFVDKGNSSLSKNETTTVVNILVT